MDRRTTFVTAGVTALVAVTATAAVAVNTGLLSVPDDDVAGTLQLPAAEVAQVEDDAVPTDVETVYVDVYDQPADPSQQETIVVPASPSTATASAAYEDDEYEEHDDDEYDDDEYDDDEYEEHEEYEGRDDDD